MIVLPVGENRIIVASFVSTQYQRVTEDGQTDGRTDSPVANTAVSIASYADRRAVKKSNLEAHVEVTMKRFMIVIIHFEKSYYSPLCFRTRECIMSVNQNQSFYLPRQCIFRISKMHNNLFGRFIP